MLLRLAAVINPESVPERHYFLEALQAPEIIWCIRIVLILIAIAALAIYWKMSGE